MKNLEDYLYYEEKDPDLKIYCGDCLEIMPLLPKVDLVVTDPPYEVGAKGCGLAGDRQYLKDITSAEIDRGFDEAILNRFDNWFCFCSRKQLKKIITLAEVRNWMLLTWNKPNPTPLTNNNYLPDKEYFIHSYQPGRLFGSYKDKSTYVIHPVNQNEFGHPTVKPVSLITKCITLGSQIDDLILDPFLGSGTTLVACKELNRNGIGIEINEKYCEIAVKRLKATCKPLFTDVSGARKSSTKENGQSDTQLFAV